MNDISDILQALLDRYSNTSDLDLEFQRMLREDLSFKEDYSQWCDDNGYSMKTGYRDYINEIIESQDSFWDQYREFGDDI